MGRLDYKLEAIREDVSANGGATYDADGGAVLLSRGYVVSLDFVGVVLKNAAQLTRALLRKMAYRARKYGGFVGFWKDPETGLLYVDISRVYDDETTARDVARANRQLAYYDAARGASVYLA